MTQARGTPHANVSALGVGFRTGGVPRHSQGSQNRSRKPKLCCSERPGLDAIDIVQFSSREITRIYKPKKETLLRIGLQGSLCRATWGFGNSRIEDCQKSHSIVVNIRISKQSPPPTYYRIP